MARHQRLALAGLSLAMLVSSLNTSISNAALPTLTKALEVSFQQVQWVVLAYLLAVTSLIVSAGQLGDTFGRKRLLTAGIAIFTLASLLCSISPSLGTLIAARSLQGVGAALMMSLTLALVSLNVSKERTGSAMGLLGTMSAAGTALGPSLGGGLMASLGWRAAFWVSVPLGLLALILVWKGLEPDSPSEPTTERRVDLAGTLFLAATLAGYALAMTVGHGSLWLIGASIVAAFLFVRAQSSSTRPLLDLRLFRDRLLSRSLVLNLVVSTVMMSTLVVGPFYLVGGLNLGEAATGILLSVGPIVVALTGVPAGRLADQFGADRLSRIGLGLMAVGCMSLAATPALRTLGYILSIIVVTLGYSLFQTSNNTLVMGRGVAAGRGVLSGLLNLSRNLGLVTGASTMGALFAWASGSSDVASASSGSVTLGMQVTFGVSSAVILASMIAGSVLKDRLPCVECPA